MSEYCILNMNVNVCHAFASCAQLALNGFFLTLLLLIRALSSNVRPFVCSAVARAAVDYSPFFHFCRCKKCLSKRKPMHNGQLFYYGVVLTSHINLPMCNPNCHLKHIKWETTTYEPFGKLSAIFFKCLHGFLAKSRKRMRRCILLCIKYAHISAKDFKFIHTLHTY